MSEQDYEQLTLFQEDSRASHSLLPGSEEARKMTVTSGLKCCELYEKSGPLGCLVRMCLGYSIWHSTRCLLHWKTKATKSKRLLFQLVASTPRTKETASPLWPTTSTGAALCGGTANFQTLKRFAELGIITEEERRNLSQGNGGKTNPAFLEWLMGYEQNFTRLIPTPIASDYNGATKNRFPGGAALSSQTVRTDRNNAVWDNWPPEPGVGRVVDGLPDRVDRIKCLGNAVVPKQFYPFFAAIRAVMDIEMRIT